MRMCLEERANPCRDGSLGWTGTGRDWSHRYGWACSLVHSPADISLDPLSPVQPNLFVIPAEIELPVRGWSQASSLLLVIEVISPRTARHDRAAKRAHYQGAHVPEYWIVDADARLVERWRPDDTRPEIVTRPFAWQPRPGGAALTIALPAPFGEVERVAGAPDA